MNHGIKVKITRLMSVSYCTQHVPFSLNKIRNKIELQSKLTNSNLRGLALKFELVSISNW